MIFSRTVSRFVMIFISETQPTYYIRQDVAQFMPDYKDKDLFTTHDGANAMKKVSRLLKVLTMCTVWHMLCTSF